MAVGKEPAFEAKPDEEPRLLPLPLFFLSSTVLWIPWMAVSELVPLQESVPKDSIQAPILSPEGREGPGAGVSLGRKARFLRQALLIFG